MSNVTVITSNPEPDSLTNAVGQAFAGAAVGRGAQADVIDLHAIGFNPAYTLADREHYLGRGELPSDVAALQERMADADVIAFVFPVYWYGMPAMVKGFFDRVLCRGFAYYAGGKPGRLVGKKVRVILLTGSSRQWYESDGVDELLRTLIIRQTFKRWCGVEDVDFLYVDGVSMGDDSPDKRALAAAKLDEVRALAASLV